MKFLIVAGLFFVAVTFSVLAIAEPEIETTDDGLDRYEKTYRQLYPELNFLALPWFSIHNPVRQQLYRSKSNNHTVSQQQNASILAEQIMGFLQLIPSPILYRKLPGDIRKTYNPLCFPSKNRQIQDQFFCTFERPISDQKHFPRIPAPNLMKGVTSTGFEVKNGKTYNDFNISIHRITENEVQFLLHEEQGWGRQFYECVGHYKTVHFVAELSGDETTCVMVYYR